MCNAWHTNGTACHDQLDSTKRKLMLAKPWPYSRHKWNIDFLQSAYMKFLILGAAVSDAYHLPYKILMNVHNCRQKKPIQFAACFHPNLLRADEAEGGLRIRYQESCNGYRSHKMLLKTLLVALAKNKITKSR